MSLMAADRLFGALLVEMVSGNYTQGERFLSHRQIMRQWRVSATTATKALERLSAVHAVRVVDRSGHYLTDGFRERALSALSETNSLASDPTPLQRHRLGMKALLHLRTGLSMKSVAAVLVLEGDGLLRRENYGHKLAHCPASSLTARGVFLEAEELGVVVHFFLCDGSVESERRTLNRVLNSRADGVILVKRQSHFREGMFGKSLLQRGVPVVVLYGEPGNSDMVSGNFNNVGMGVRAADYFLQKGHRNLAALIYRKADISFEDRLNGFRLGAAGADASVTEFRMITHPEQLQDIAAEVRRKKITAIFSTTQYLMASLLPALKEATISLPDEVSLLMCSSTPEVPYFPWNVDTLILEFTLLGRIAVQALNSYCSGRVAQRMYLLNPMVEACDSVIKLPRGS